MQKNTKIIVIGIIVLFGLMGIVIGNHSSFENDLDDLKPVARVNNVNLLLLQQKEDKTFEAATEEVRDNSILGFNLSSNLPIYIALFVAENDQQPKVLLKSARIPPGKNKHLDKGGIPFLYHVSQNQKKLNFCILHEDNDKDLQKNLLKINKEWAKIPQFQCSTVHVSTH